MIDGIPNRPLYFYQEDIIGHDEILMILEGPRGMVELLQWFTHWLWLT